MRRLSCLVTLLAAGLMPGAAVAQEAGPPFRLDELRIEGNAIDSDGIFGPGESVNIFTKFTPSVVWVEGGAPANAMPEGTLAVSPAEDPTISVTGDGKSLFNPALIGEGTENNTAFGINLASNYQCGRATPLRLTLKNGDGEVYSPITIPVATGGVGATKTYTGTDYGKVLVDRSSVNSGIEVDAAGYVKHVRVSIKDFSHRYSLKWSLITLEHAGRTATLWNRHDTSAKVMEDVVFDDRAEYHADEYSDGPDGVPSTADDADGYRGTTMAPVDVLDSVFDGVTADGEWTLRVTDINSDNIPRSGGRGARSGEVNESAVGLVGEWTLGLAEGACDPAQPQAWFGPEPLIFSPVGGQTLDASVSSDPGKALDGDVGAIATYAWDFDGDGLYGTDDNPDEPQSSSPTVSLPGLSLGTHTVGVKITDSDGNVGTHSTQILIDNKPVVSTPTQTPEFPQVNQDTTLSISASDPDAGQGAAGAIASIDWDLNGDGTFESTGGSGNTSKTLQWPTQGNKIVRVRVTDGLGVSTIHVFNIYLGNRPPVAGLVVSSPAHGKPVAGQTASLSAASSTDPDGTIVSYEWNFGEGYGDPVTSPTINHVFPNRGDDSVTVRVMDDGGKSDEITLPITVTAAPVPRMTFSPTLPAPGETITLDATGSSDEDGHTLTKFEWDLDSNLSFDDATGTVVDTSYATAGVKVVNLRVTDATGATSQSSFAIMVKSPTPNPTPTPTPPPGGGGTPTPTPTPAPGGGGKTPTPTPKPGTGGGTVDPETGLIIPGSDLFDGPDPGEEGTVNDFSAKITAGAKQKTKKVIKAGVPVALTVSAAGTAQIKPMLTVKDAKKLGLKLKKTTAVGLGKVVITKGGKVKVAVKISKRYAKYVKKAKKTPVTLRAVVTNADGDAVPLSRKVTLVK